jgi:hypothetical protein
VRPTYRIKDWDQHFETTESRRVQHARWVPMPNKQDGKGYRRIAQHKKGVEIFCAWTLMLQIASKMPVRGVLADHDGPLDAEDIAAKTGFPIRIFDLALEFLSDPRVGWLVTDRPNPQSSAEPAEVSAESRRSPALFQPEGNGIEGKDKEPKTPLRSAAAPVRVVFDFWREHLKHPKAVLDSKRERAIAGRLKAGFSVDDLCAAIRGCALTPYNMGQNDQHRIYDDIELICRDAKHVEMFLARANGNGVVSERPAFMASAK